jgi:hypothetical protein
MVSKGYLLWASRLFVGVSLCVGAGIARGQNNTSRDVLVNDQAAFQSSTAVACRAPGSPVGPPAKVVICHNGKTISVAEPAVAAHLAHGDTLGPCPGNEPGTRPKGNNGVGNGIDPQPPGNPPINDGPGTSPGNPGNRGGPNR